MDKKAEEDKYCKVWKSADFRDPTTMTAAQLFVANLRIDDGINRRLKDNGEADRYAALLEEQRQRLRYTEKRKPTEKEKDEIRRQFGFVNREGEFEKYFEHAKKARGASKREVNAKKNQAWRKRKKLEPFEKRMRELPANGDPKAEMDWIASHPAMARSMLVDDESLMKVTYKDIDKDCPSQAAVIALMHWINNPAKFHEQRLSEQKKEITRKNAAEDASAPDELDDMKSVDDLWKAVRGE